MKKIVFVAVIFIGVLILLSVTAPIIAGWVFDIASETSASASVGIIGGADGPTAIMVTETADIGSIIVTVAIGVLLIAAGIWGLKKTKTKNNCTK